MVVDKREISERAVSRLRRGKKPEEPVRKAGCFVPLAAGCIKGMPLPKSLEEGVKMVCSNGECPFKDQLIHKECFNALEDFLVKIISNLGSARGWTESQRYANLWDRKGYSLIQKSCRCLCGLGLLRLDDNAHFLAQRDNVRAPAAGSAKHKKQKGKNLPKLNFNKKSTVTENSGANIFQDFAYSKPSGKSRGRSPPRSPASYDAFHSKTTNGENWSMSYAKCVGTGDCTSGMKGEYTRVMSSAPLPTKLEKANVEKTTKLKSRLVSEALSYAKATATNAPLTEDCEISREESQTMRGGSPVELGISSISSSDVFFTSDEYNTNEQLSGRQSLFSEDCSELKLFDDYFAEDNTDSMEDNFNAAISESVSSLFPATAGSTIASSIIFDASIDQEFEEEEDEEEEDDNEDGDGDDEENGKPYYTLFGEYSFLLGERLFANAHLPGLL